MKKAMVLFIAITFFLELCTGWLAAHRLSRSRFRQKRKQSLHLLLRLLRKKRLLLREASGTG